MNLSQIYNLNGSQPQNGTLSRIPSGRSLIQNRPKLIVELPDLTKEIELFDWLANLQLSKENIMAALKSAKQSLRLFAIIENKFKLQDSLDILLSKAWKIENQQNQYIKKIHFRICRILQVCSRHIPELNFTKGVIIAKKDKLTDQVVKIPLSHIHWYLLSNSSKNFPHFDEKKVQNESEKFLFKNQVSLMNLPQIECNWSKNRTDEKTIHSLLNIMMLKNLSFMETSETIFSMLDIWDLSKSLEIQSIEKNMKTLFEVFSCKAIQGFSQLKIFLIVYCKVLVEFPNQTSIIDFFEQYIFIYLSQGNFPLKISEEEKLAFLNLNTIQSLRSPSANSSLNEFYDLILLILGDLPIHSFEAKNSNNTQKTSNISLFLNLLASEPSKAIKYCQTNGQLPEVFKRIFQPIFFLNQTEKFFQIEGFERNQLFKYLDDLISFKKNWKLDNSYLDKIFGMELIDSSYNSKLWNAIGYYMTQKWDVALKCLNELILAKPNAPLPYFLRGRINGLFKIDKWSEARLDILKAVELHKEGHRTLPRAYQSILDLHYETELANLSLSSSEFLNCPLEDQKKAYIINILRVNLLAEDLRELNILEFGNNTNTFIFRDTELNALQGRRYLFNEKSLGLAEGRFSNAVKFNPECALGHAGMAYVYWKTKHPLLFKASLKKAKEYVKIDDELTNKFIKEIEALSPLPKRHKTKDG